ncbi:putative cation-transporting ATPase 13A3 [Platysternon megacephalum]|uniref:Putative cation-transporting ATPase 13A3 n=1 Tax=Platysternon megacephalum TaxID=55544 RepID=A0A4D9E115_9SAUR|nr:putative cation-transporting ATPase 13A3 [Platysternon megacephalum]
MLSLLAGKSLSHFICTPSSIVELLWLRECCKTGTTGSVKHHIKYSSRCIKQKCRPKTFVLSSQFQISIQAPLNYIHIMKHPSVFNNSDAALRELEPYTAVTWSDRTRRDLGFKNTPSPQLLKLSLSPSTTHFLFMCFIIIFASTVPPSAEWIKR